MNNRDFLYNFYKQSGMPDHVIAGILGNASAESGFDPAAKNNAGGGGGAVGIFQWRGPRLKALQAFADSRGTAVTDLATQAAFSLQELNGTEKGALSKLMAAKNPRDAFMAFRDNYERSGGVTGDASGYARGSRAADAAFRTYTDPSYAPSPTLSYGSAAPTPAPNQQVTANDYGVSGIQAALTGLLGKAQAGNFGQTPMEAAAAQAGIADAQQRLNQLMPSSRQAPTRPVTQPTMSPDPRMTIGEPAFAPPQTPTPAPQATAQQPTQGSAMAQAFSSAGYPVQQSQRSTPVGGTPAGTVPQRAPQPHAAQADTNPWNWKLGLAQGLEGLGVGLAQMSTGATVNLNPMRTRIDNTRLGNRAADTAQFNADTARAREQRLSTPAPSTAASPQVDPNNVAQLMQADGNYTPTQINAVLSDPTGATAKAVLSQIVTASAGAQPDFYATDKGVAAFDAASAGALTPSQQAAMSPAMKAEWVKNNLSAGADTTSTSPDFYSTPKGILAFTEASKGVLSPAQRAAMSPAAKADWVKNNLSSAPQNAPAAAPVTLQSDPVQFSAASDYVTGLVSQFTASGDKAAAIAATRAQARFSSPNADAAAILSDLNKSLANVNSQTNTASAQTAAAVTAEQQQAADARSTQQKADDRAAIVAMAGKSVPKAVVDRLATIADTGGLDAARAELDRVRSQTTAKTSAEGQISAIFGDTPLASELLARADGTNTKELIARGRAVQQTNTYKAFGAPDTVLNIADPNQQSAAFDQWKATTKAGEDASRRSAAAEAVAATLDPATQSGVIAMLKSGDPTSVNEGMKAVSTLAGRQAATTLQLIKYASSLPADQRQAFWQRANNTASVAVGASSDKQTMRDRTLNESFVKRMNAEQTTIDNEKQFAETLRAMQALVNSPNYESGPISQATAQVRSVVQQLTGSKYDPTLTMQKTVRGMANGLIQSLRAPGSGVMTDNDFKQLLSSVFDSMSSPMTTKLLVQSKLESLDRATAVAAFDRTWYADAGNSLAMGPEYDAAKAAYLANNKIPPDNVQIISVPNTNNSGLARTQAILDNPYLQDGDVYGVLDANGNMSFEVLDRSLLENAMTIYQNANGLGGNQ